MPKNILVFSDGTGQKGGEGYNTNVYKLFNMVEDRTQNQIAYYDPGLGTDWRKITGNILGRGFKKNLLDCYRFIFQNFEADDKIFLFGFSRGAATVRSLSGFIHLFGILPKCREDLIKDAFDIYEIEDKEERELKAQAFIDKHHTMWCKVHFIGVWDTVAALGLSSTWLGSIFNRFWPHKFHSFDLSESVKYTRHAISIDDSRKTFHPVLWNALKNDPNSERMKQVWFCGVHTDVGGGYEKEDLSNITLRWMIKEAKAKGLRLYKEAKALKKLKESEPNVNGPMHSEVTGWKKYIYSQEQRSWKTGFGPLWICESVKQRVKNQDNTESPAYKAWILDHKDHLVEPMVKAEEFRAMVDKDI